MAATPPGELIPVLISFDAARTFSASERAALEAMPKEERKTYVAQEIVSFARQEQNAVLNLLRSAEGRGEAERIRSIEIASAASGRLTAETIRAVAARPEVRRIAWDRPVPVEQVLDETASEPAIEAEAIEPAHKLLPDPEPEWGVAKIRAPELWPSGITGTSTLAAVIDNGCDYKHPDLADHLWDGLATDGSTQLWYDANGDSIRASDGSEDLVNHGWDTVGDDNDPIENIDNHGTKSAGVVVGDGTGSGSEQRQTGVAPDATLMCILSSGVGQASLMEGFNFLLGMRAQWGSLFKLPDIVTMSATWKFYFDPVPEYEGWRDLTDNVLALGLAHTNSIGNEGDNIGGGCDGQGKPIDGLAPIPYNISAPGNAPPPWLHPDQPAPVVTGASHVSSVNSVGAVNRSDQAHVFSSRGPAAWEDIQQAYPCQKAISSVFWDYLYLSNALLKPDVAAPSADGLYSTGCTSGVSAGGTLYCPFGGTSAATPHVAGTVALMKQVNPDLTPAEVSEVLQTTAVPLGAPGKDNVYGAGRIDAYAAVQFVLERFGGTLPQDFVIPAGETWDFEAVTVAFAPGARLIVEGTLNADGTTFTEATTGQGWGGIRVENGGFAFLRANSIVRDVKSFGGAAVYVYGRFDLENSEIIGSPLGAGADGIYASGSSAEVYVEDGSFIRNNEGDGIYAASSARVYVSEESRVQDNDGHGVYAANADVFLHDSFVLDNEGYGARATYFGSVNFGFPFVGYPPPSQNNDLDDNTVGTLSATSYADLSAGATGGNFINNNLIRNGSELHAYARTSSDVRAQCDYWGSSSGPNLSFMDTDGSSTYTYSPFLTAPGESCGGGIGNRAAPGTAALSASARGASEHRPEQVPPLVWEALQVADRGETEAAFGLLVSAIQTAATDDDAARAYAVLTRLARRGPAQALAAFLAAQSNRPSERPWALAALTEVHVAEGRPAEAATAASSLVEEYGGTEHALFGYAALHALAVEAGDGAGAEAALAAVEAGWPEHDATAMMQREHTLRLEVESGDGARRAPTGGIAAKSGAPSTSEEGVVDVFALEAAYPNPSDGTVTLPLVLAERAEAEVVVYDVLGREVAVLAEGERAAGRHDVSLETAGLPAGVYVARATVRTADGTARSFAQMLTIID